MVILYVEGLSKGRIKNENKRPELHIPIIILGLGVLKTSREQQCDRLKGHIEKCPVKELACYVG